MLSQNDKATDNCRHIAMLAYTDSEILDICAPLDVFAFVNKWLQLNGKISEPVYTLSILANQAGPVTTSSGMRIVADAAYENFQGCIDTLMIAGGFGAERATQDRKLIAWLVDVAPQVRRLASICTGAFLLAESGLLDGRRATTHWYFSSQLAQRYPNVRVEEDSIYVRDGSIYTSGGITTGIDLALALVEEDWGHEIALMVARGLVVFMSRPGGQSQFSTLMLNEAKTRKDFRAMQAWITGHPQADLSVAALAERVSMSPRNFSRVFCKEVGIPPAKFVELIRLEAARNQLERTSSAVDVVAGQCGFGNAEHMRRTFQRHLKVSPQDYRERFRPQGGTYIPGRPQFIPPHAKTRRTIMRILLISSAYNGLCQRVHVELDYLGHDISVTLALSAEDVRKAVNLFQPEVIVCPFLKEKIPEDVYGKHHCIIVHPGIRGDRGPSSLDWAIMNEEPEWGSTALQAVEEMDAGDIWSSHTFKMRQTSKASLYRREATQAAVKAVLETVERIADGDFVPEPLDYADPTVSGQLRPLLKQTERRIDWTRDNVRTILKKIHAGDSAPGVLDTIYGEEYYLYGAHEENQLQGWQPGAIIAQRHGAICRAAIDGAVWISHLKKKNAPRPPFYKRFFANQRIHDYKLPAARVLGELLAEVPESSIDLLYMGTEKTYREIWYEEQNEVGYLHFDFHNGAMDTTQCRRLRDAYRAALARPTKVLVLMGGCDFWSNGVHLNIIEAADNPANESWRNINAIDDVVLEILTTQTKFTVSAVWGGAGAGGAMALLAADRVWAREGAVFNPHYKTMGLYGSEYWTYSLPKRVGPVKALELTETPLPLGMKKAKSIGYIDEILPDDYAAYREQVRQKAEALASHPDYERLLQEKNFRRQKDEQAKPLAAYRASELRHMKMNFSGKFYGGGVNYHEARYNFVHKVRPKETAAYLAKHMQLDMARLNELWQPLTY